jgi:hypothetical protein
MSYESRPQKRCGLQRGHGLGASLSKPIIPVRSSHWPHHGGREGCCRAGGGSSSGDSRATSTANGFLIPVVLAPANSARPSRVQPRRVPRRWTARACGAAPRSIATGRSGWPERRRTTGPAPPPPGLLPGPQVSAFARTPPGRIPGGSLVDRLTQRCPGSPDTAVSGVACHCCHPRTACQGRHSVRGCGQRGPRSRPCRRSSTRPGRRHDAPRPGRRPPAERSRGERCDR